MDVDEPCENEEEFWEGVSNHHIKEIWLAKIVGQSLTILSLRRVAHWRE